MQGLSQRAWPNTIPCSCFPNLLRNPEEETEDPFLLDLIDLIPMKLKSEPPSSMLFKGISNIKEDKEEGDHQMTTTLEEGILPMMSLMRQVSRTMSPSPRLRTLNLWDPSHKSSTGIEPEQKRSSLSTSGTSC